MNESLLSGSYTQWYVVSVCYDNIMLTLLTDDAVVGTSRSSRNVILIVDLETN